MELSSLHKRIKSTCVLFVISITFSIILAWVYNHHADAYYNVKNFQTTLIKKKHEAKAYSKQLLVDMSEGRPWWVVDKSKKDKPEYYNFLIYKDDSLKAWSGQVLPYRKEDLFQNSSNKILKLKNTWYWIHVYNNSYGYKLVSLISIRNEYNYSNIFLKDEYTIKSPYSSCCCINTKNIKGQSHFYDEDGSYLFSVKNNKEKNTTYAYLSIAFILLGLLTYFQLLIRILKKITDIKYKQFVYYGSILFTLGLYLIHSYCKEPGILFETSLFSPLHFGLNRFLSSLGSLLILSIMVYAYAIIFYRQIGLNKILSIRNKHVRLAFNLFVGVVVWTVVNHIIIIMFDHSPEVSLVHKITNMSFYGVVRIFISTLLWFSAILILDRILISLQANYSKYYQLLILGIIVLISLLFCVNTLDYIIQGVVIIVYLLLLGRHKTSKHVYTTFIWFLFFFSAYAVILFSIHNFHKERGARRLLIDNLSSRLTLEENPLSELFLREKENAIQEDSILSTSLINGDENISTVEKYFTKEYLKGYLSRYKVRITISRFNEHNVNNQVANSSYKHFSKLIKDSGVRVLGSKHFYFLDSVANMTTYFGLFTYNKSALNETTILLKLVSKPFYERAGYHELLLTTRERKLKKPFDNYSYGKYIDGKLVKQTGDFTYPKSLSVANRKLKDFDIFKYASYDHMIFHSKSNVVVVLSLPIVGFSTMLISFSIYFILYFIFSIVLVSFTHLRRGRLLKNISIQERIQLSIIGLMLVLLLVIAGASVWQSIIHFQEKNYKVLSEKNKSILIELENKLNLDNVITENNPVCLKPLLNKLSNTFYTDINIYSLKGRLLLTSQPELYEKDLQSHLMNSSAFMAMKNDPNKQFIQYENIGGLKFLSAYLPFYNYQNKILAYVNVPYFVGMKELKEEVSSTVVGILNFYLIFLIIVFALTVVISRQITYPLLVVKDKMSKLQLGVRNEKIEYTWNDEVGKLVYEYNRMVDELTNSAEALAKSQREFAWREMAQQIAHEIKNPLTPMKLSIQYLEMAHKDGADNFDLKLERVSSTLIEQIDKLSLIASEFSNFAKIPVAQRKEINIIDSLLQCVHLFDKERKVVFKVINEVGEEYPVFADSKQLISVFNNLLKNAIQSIPEKRSGQIEICIQRDDSNIMIHIKDNGRGVPDDIKDKLFMPNFTTKSSGMGLGLAIVKNMVNINKGSVWFETNLDEGSTFSVKFPVYNAITV